MYSCILRCQYDGQWLADRQMPYCFNSQDTAMYHLSTALSVSSAIKSVLSSDTFTAVVTIGSGIVPVALSYYSFGTVTEYDLSFNDPRKFTLNDDFHIAVSADALCRRVLYNVSIVGIRAFKATIRNRQTFFVMSVANGGRRNYTPPTALQLDVTVYYKPHGWSFVSTPHRVIRSSSSDLYSENITAVDLCQRPWYGVTCALGEVVALDLTSLELIGELPTALGLLTALTALILSSNSITGSIPTSIGNLNSSVNLQLKYNELVGPIPIQLSQLTRLAYADFRYNQFSGTVPIFFAAMTNLLALYMDSNQFSGTVPSSFCEAIKDIERGLMFSITADPKLSCYQDPCWTTFRSNHTLSNCLVSSTSVAKSSLSYVLVIIMVSSMCQSICLAYCLIACCTYREKTEKKKKKKKSEVIQLPVHQALLDSDCMIRCAILYRNLRYCFRQNDQQQSRARDLLELIRSNIHTVNFSYEGHTALSIILTGKCKIPVTADVVAALIETALPFDPVTMEMAPSERHSYVWADVVQREDPLVVFAVGIILSKYQNRAVELSNCEDAKGGRCVDIASRACKEIILRKIYLHERYEIKTGPPEHRSATSLVVLALDHNGWLRNRIEAHNHSERDYLSLPKNVALKSMQNRDQYLREVETRRRCGFDDRYVLATICSFDGDAEDVENISFRTDSIAKGYLKYPYCVVMEAGTMSLRQVVDQQYFVGKNSDTIRAMVKQITLALRHVHERGIIHGDVKGTVERDEYDNILILECAHF